MTNVGSLPQVRGPQERYRSASPPGSRGRMPRYIIEREFPGGLRIPVDEVGATSVRAVVHNNLAEQVTWVHSYVSADKTRTFCVWDGPSPEAIRRAANRSRLPVTRITEVSVLDPYFYR